MKNKQKYLFRSRHAKTALYVACTLLAASPVAVQAACGTLFEATVTSVGISQQLCRDSIESLYENAIRDAGSLFPSYTETSNLSSNVRVLGVDAALNYAENSRTLTFVIPDLGINQSFTGATRCPATSHS
jgi:hypothetical protein